MSYLSKWPESFLGSFIIRLKRPSEAYRVIRFGSYLLTRRCTFLFVRRATVAESPHGALMGYVLGKAEGDGPLWHGHVSALTVAPAYRRLGLAKTLMEKFEDACVHTYNAYFVDLFVRSSNTLAIRMYEKFGYSTYRRVLGYYSGELPEDALDMRKALPRYSQCSVFLCAASDVSRY
jgi:ribosomal protein S18 acetylase RimI-like enzyme